MIAFVIRFGAVAMVTAAVAERFGMFDGLAAGLALIALYPMRQV